MDVRSIPGTGIRGCYSPAPPARTSRKYASISSPNAFALCPGGARNCRPSRIVIRTGNTGVRHGFQRLPRYITGHVDEHRLHRRVRQHGHQRKPLLERVHRRADRPRALGKNEQVLSRPQGVASHPDEFPPMVVGQVTGQPRVLPMNGLFRTLFFIRHVSRGIRARKCGASIRLGCVGAMIVPRRARTASASGKSTVKHADPLHDRLPHRQHPMHHPLTRPLAPFAAQADRHQPARHDGRQRHRPVTREAHHRAHVVRHGVRQGTVFHGRVAASGTPGGMPVPAVSRADRRRAVGWPPLAVSGGFIGVKLNHT